MESPAEEYQRIRKEKMQTLKSILQESEHAFLNTEDAFGDEVYEIFQLAASISGGLLEYQSAANQTLDEGDQAAVITYLLNTEGRPQTINLTYKINEGIVIFKICNELNDLLKTGGYKGEKYFYDISQDVDRSGIAFTEFARELALSESGAVWRGYPEMEMFEAFWSKVNKNKPG